MNDLNEQTVVDRLMRDEAYVAECVLALYARQTEDERETADTVHANGRGFNFRDAPFLTSIAKALPRYRNHMTPRQLSALRRILPKYRRQLLEIATEQMAMQQRPALDVVEIRQQTPIMFGWF